VRNWLETQWARFGFLVLLAGCVIAAVVMAWGCSKGPNTAAAVKAHQDAVLFCILSGGTPVAGVNNTVVCK